MSVTIIQLDRDGRRVATHEGKACPFCGGTELSVQAPTPTWVFCGACEACGPAAESVVEAVEAWNARKEAEQ